jgi:hypothetical protein
MSYKCLTKTAARLWYIAVFIAPLLLSGCEKEEPPPEYFEQCLVGTWCVREFYTSDGITIIHDQEDCVEYYRYVSSKIYTVDNPAFCNLEYIDNIQVWTIARGQNGLAIIVADLCEKVDKYVMSYINLRYDEPNNGPGTCAEGIAANVSLIGAKNTVILSSFVLFPDSGEIWLTMRGEKDSDYKIRLCQRPE